MSASDAFVSRYGPVAAVLGAGQGIGRAFALALAERGLDLLLVDVDAPSLAAVEGEVVARGRDATALRLDLGAPDAGARLARAASGREVGLAVYSAARAPVGPFLDADPAGHADVVAVNCAGAQAACHAFGRPMRARGRGALVLLSSLAGLQGTGHVAAYSASKAFELALAEALWEELAPAGVEVLAVVAGSTDTPGFRASGAAVDPAALEAPEAVAREALEHLADGPAWVVGEASRRIAAALEGLPRAERVRMISEQTRRIYSG